MANHSDDTHNHSPECSTETGSDKSFVGKFVSGLISNTPLSKWFGGDKESPRQIRRRTTEDDDDEDSIVLQPPLKRPKLPTATASGELLYQQHHQQQYHQHLHQQQQQQLRNNYTGGDLFESPRVTPSVTIQNTSSNSNKIINNNVSTSTVFNNYSMDAIPGPSGVKSRKLCTSSSYRDNTSSTSLVINGDNDSDSEESTSGYSSAPRLQHKDDKPTTTTTNTIKNRDELNVSDHFRPGNANTTRSLFNSTYDESNSRSLFSERSLSPQVNTSLSSRRPKFNASIFGSPNFIDRTLATKRIMNSPFYTGRTMYGGASSATAATGTPTPTRPSVLIRPVKQRKSGDNSDNITLSKTARRILNTLEQYSTPISDAKKIPISSKYDTDKSTSNSGILSKYIGVNPYIRQSKATASNKQLQVPSIPELIQLKQKERLQNSTESVRQIAATSKSDLNKKEYKLPIEDDNNLKVNKQTKHSNKIKTSLSSVRQKNQIETRPEVHLPSISLPINTLPKLDFVLPPPQQQEQQSDKIEVSSETTFSINSKKPSKTTPENNNNNLDFIFSKPVVISENFKTIQAINSFKFSEPVSKKTKDEVPSTSKELMFKMPDNNKPVPPKLKNNGENVKSAPQLLSGSVMDVLKKKNTVENLDKFKPASNTWECTACLVRNADDKDKCVACEMAREKKTAAPPPPLKTDFGTQFKVSKDKWECDVCMVRNDNTSDACVACTTPKPGSKPKAPETTTNIPQFSFGIPSTAKTGEKTAIITSKTESSTIPTFSFGIPITTSSSSNVSFSFGVKPSETSTKTTSPVKTNEIESLAKFKPPSNMWECAACFVRNTDDKDKCIACEMVREKPKGFGSEFKMPKDKWECSSCMVRNDNSHESCCCCGTAKPGSTNNNEKLNSSNAENKVINFNFGVVNKSNTPQFSFGIPPAASSKTEEVTSTKSSEQPTTSFAFGVGSSSTVTTTTTTTTGFSFGVKDAKKSDDVTPQTSKVDGSFVAGGFKFNLDKNSNQQKSSSESSFPNKIELPASLSADRPTKKQPSFDFNKSIPAVNGEIGESKGSNFNNKPDSTTSIPSTTVPTFKFDAAISSTVSSTTNSSLNTSTNTLFKFGSNETNKRSFSDVNEDQQQPSSNGFANATASKNTPKPINFGTSDSTKTSTTSGILAPAFNTSDQKTFGTLSNPTKAAATTFANKSFGPTDSKTMVGFGNTDKPIINFGKPFGNTSDNKLTGFNIQDPKSAFNSSSDGGFGVPPSVKPFGTPDPKPIAFGTDLKSSISSFGTPDPKPIIFETKSPANIFGTVATSTEPKPSGNIFGVPAEPQKPAAVAGIFGAATEPQKQSTFFGNPAEPPKPFQFENAAAPKPAAGIFTFGQGEKSDTAATAAVATPFKFGGSAASAFGDSTNSVMKFSTAPQPVENMFSFGKTSEPTVAPQQAMQPIVTAAAATPAAPNIFGSGTSWTKNGSFNFGTVSNNNNNQKAIFTFGASQTNQPQPTQQPPSSFGVPPSQPSQTGFNFGASMPAAPPSGFNFSGATPSFNFSDGNSASTSQPQRKYRKAIRRTTTHR